MSLVKTLLLSSIIISQGSALLAMDEEARYSRTRFISAQVEDIEDSPEDYILNPTRTNTEQVEEIEEFSDDHIPNPIKDSREKIEEIDSSSDEEMLKTSSDEFTPPGSSQGLILIKSNPQNKNITPTSDDAQNTNPGSTSTRDYLVRNYSKKSWPFTTVTFNRSSSPTNIRQRFIIATKPTLPIKKKRHAEKSSGLTKKLNKLL